MIKQLLSAGIEGLKPLMPGLCMLCNGHSFDTLCAGCYRSLPKNLGPKCSCCDLPLMTQATRCAECLSRPPRFDQVVSGWVYQPPVDIFIKRFKEQKESFWLSTLSKVLIQNITETYDKDQPDIVVATPIHWVRKISRGYNQSALLARNIAAELKLPHSNSVKKIRYTRPQKHLNRQQRLRNLSRSFACSRRFDGLHVALVDDVMTTGATVETLASLLKDHGASKVSVWVLARTPKV